MPHRDGPQVGLQNTGKLSRWEPRPRHPFPFHQHLPFSSHLHDQPAEEGGGRAWSAVGPGGQRV